MCGMMLIDMCGKIGRIKPKSLELLVVILDGPRTCIDGHFKRSCAPLLESVTIEIRQQNLKAALCPKHNKAGPYKRKNFLDNFIVYYNVELHSSSVQYEYNAMVYIIQRK